MNVHLLYICTMARITDTNKIERLKVSTMKLVAENGYGGASAALIAKDAEVAVGYFYLHYKGKYALVNSLLSGIYNEFATKLNELINEGSSFDALIENIIDFYIDLANTEPVKLKFFHVISNDYRFKLDPDIRDSIFSLINSIVKIGQKEDALDKNLTIDDLYMYLVINIIQHINQRFKHSDAFYTFKKSDKDHIVYLVNKILK